MSNGWLTSKDVFDPAETLLKIQQIKRAKQEQELIALKTQQAQRDFAKTRAFENWRSGQSQQPPQMQQVPPQMQQMQQPDPQMMQEQQAALRGQKKLASMTGRIDQEYASPKIDGAKVNRINQMKRRDPDISSLIKSSGFDDIDFGYDEKKQIAWERYTKDWSKEELEKIAESVPGGQALAGLPAGKYTLEFDPISQTMRPSVKSASGAAGGVGLIEDKNLTDNDLARAVALGNPQERRQAQAILDAKSRFRTEQYQSKYGGNITGEGIDFAAQQYVFSGKMPPMGRNSFIRSLIMEKAASIAANVGISVPQLMTMQAEKKGLVVSLNQQIKNRGAMGSFVRNLTAQTDLLKTKLPDLIRAGSRVANIPIRSYLTKIKGSGDEAVFETYLTEISSEIAKLATGSTGSVAEVSASAREKWEEIHDKNLPVSEIIKLVDSIKHLGDLRLKSVDDEIDATKSKLAIAPGQTNFRDTTPAKKRTINRAGRTKDGRRVILYSDGSREYVQ